MLWYPVKHLMKLAKLFCRVMTAFCKLTSKEWEFLLLCILTIVWYGHVLFFLPVLVSVEWYLLVVLIYFSIIANDGDHLWYAYFPFWIVPLMKSLFWPLPIFKEGSLLSYCWVFRAFLIYYWYKSFLKYIIFYLFYFFFRWIHFLYPG